MHNNKTLGAIVIVVSMLIAIWVAWSPLAAFIAFIVLLGEGPLFIVMFLFAGLIAMFKVFEVWTFLILLIVYLLMH
jgi:hypothetical protein